MTTGGRVFSTEFAGWQRSVPRLLEQAQLVSVVRATGRKVILLVNLVEDLAPPITTPVDCVREVVRYIKKQGVQDLVIAAGCGSIRYETQHCFTTLGYDRLSLDEQVELVDLNQESSKVLTNPECGCFPQMYLPELLFGAFLISIPVLKAHTLAGVTLTMKNMMGAPPPEQYQQGGHWKKSSFHANMDEAIFDLNRYRTPDFTLLDATVGMQEAHLYGPECNPPKNKLACGFDPVAIDAWGADLLGFGWQSIGHICRANGVLGTAKYAEQSLLA